MNQTPRGNRVHIALFGKRNAGKSSLINSLTGQQLSVVSDVLGTTTDPVYKSMELLPIGPIVMIDTAGLDDEGDLGDLRVKKTYEVLNKTDLALLVIDATSGVTSFEIDLLGRIKEKKIPVVGILNKTDITSVSNDQLLAYEKTLGLKLHQASALDQTGIKELKNQMIKVLPDDTDKFKLVGDLIQPSDIVVLVVPIDKAAPKGRLILPQQQVIRDVLESDAMTIVTKEYELKETLESLKRKPKLVITDSQVFSKVSADTPSDILLTSFSILFARYKGDLIELIKGAKQLDKLADGDKILIAEGCTHHRQSDDIATVKIPRWIRQYTGKQIDIEFVSGMTYPDNLEQYKLIVHCGGCMLNRREIQHRIGSAKVMSVPIVNYGVLIAYVQGIMPRILEPFPLAKMMLEM